MPRININAFPPDLKIAKELVYDKCGFDFKNPSLQAEGSAYGACSFMLDKKIILYRISNITPTKAGQFVTLWKRNKNGITEPYSLSDSIDLVIITSKSGNNAGQFIFPKSALIENGIISSNTKEGKRGIRVYPPWDVVTNKQALKTQTWQVKYFLTIQENNLIDLMLAKRLITST